MVAKCMITIETLPGKREFAVSPTFRRELFWAHGKILFHRQPRGKLTAKILTHGKLAICRESRGWLTANSHFCRESDSSSRQIPIFREYLVGCWGFGIDYEKKSFFRFQGSKVVSSK
jgi:hypothetical protein